jgi:predicted transcriptional regulator
MMSKLEKEVNMFDRHLEILRLVIDSEPIGIVKMSDQTGYAITTKKTNEFIEQVDGKLGEVEDKLVTMKIEDS